jgi:hypothetical protein
VLTFQMHTQGSVEERVLALAARKRQLEDVVIRHLGLGQGGAGAGASDEDVRSTLLHGWGNLVAECRAAEERGGEGGAAGLTPEEISRLLDRTRVCQGDVVDCDGGGGLLGEGGAGAQGGPGQHTEGTEGGARQARQGDAPPLPGVDPEMEERMLRLVRERHAAYAAEQAAAGEGLGRGRRGGGAAAAALNYAEPEEDSSGGEEGGGGGGAKQSRGALNAAGPGAGDGAPPGPPPPAAGAAQTGSAGRRRRRRLSTEADRDYDPMASPSKRQRFGGSSDDDESPRETGGGAAEGAAAAAVGPSSVEPPLSAAAVAAAVDLLRGLPGVRALGYPCQPQAPPRPPALGGSPGGPPSSVLYSPCPSSIDSGLGSTPSLDSGASL